MASSNNKKNTVKSNRMSDAEKQAANAARLERAANKAAKTANKSKAAKAAKAQFKSVQQKKILLALFMGWVAPTLVEPTYDNMQAPAKPVTKAQKAKVAELKGAVTAPVQQVKPVQGLNASIKEAVNAALFETFKQHQANDVAQEVYAKKMAIHADFLAAMDKVRQEAEQTVMSVLADIPAIKAAAHAALLAEAEAEITAYQAECDRCLAAEKETALQNAINNNAELNGIVDASALVAMLDRAKEKAEAEAKQAAEAEAKAKAERAAKAMELYKAEQAKQQEALAKAKLAKAKQDTAKYLVEAKSFAAQATQFLAKDEANAPYKKHLNSYKQLVDNCQQLFDLGKYEEALLASKKFYALFKRELESLLTLMQETKKQEYVLKQEKIAELKQSIALYKEQLKLPMAQRSSKLDNHQINVAIRDLKQETLILEGAAK